MLVKLPTWLSTLRNASGRSHASVQRPAECLLRRWMGSPAAPQTPGAGAPTRERCAGRIARQRRPYRNGTRRRKVSTHPRGKVPAVSCDPPPQAGSSTRASRVSFESRAELGKPGLEQFLRSLLTVKSENRVGHTRLVQHRVQQGFVLTGLLEKQQRLLMLLHRPPSLPASLRRKHFRVCRTNNQTSPG